jgi:hypothetical protein
MPVRASLGNKTPLFLEAISKPEEGFGNLVSTYL